MTYKEKILKAPAGCPVDELYWALDDVGTFGQYTDHFNNDGPVGDWFASHKALIDCVPNKRTVIQAGGALGLYPLLLSPIFKNVYTFEPSDISWHFLSKNIQSIGNITANKMALGSKQLDTASSLTVTPYNLGMNKIAEVGGNIKMVTIDSLNIQDVDLIWFDLEGFEYEALLGSEQTIREYMPIIGVENPTQPIVDFLVGIGYNTGTQSKMDVFFSRK